MLSIIPLSALLCTTIFFSQGVTEVLARKKHHRNQRHSHTFNSHQKLLNNSKHTTAVRVSRGTVSAVKSNFSGKGYKLSMESSGEKFFDDWDFFTDSDPTHGMVNYQPADLAWKESLISVGPSSTDKKFTTATMRVDNSSWLGDGEYRKSVRLTSKKSFKYGLLVLDVLKMPFGCSTWPAFWTVGENWPIGGEIDIVEGVNMLTTNQMTLHTASGCNIQTPMKAEALGRVLETNCDASAASNTGCGVADHSNSSFGAPFNSNGGGVFVMEWKDSGITIWRFNRKEVPKDIKSASPDPSNWSQRPLAHWSNDACNNLSEQFSEHKIVFDITLCGDWAGSAGVYNDNGACGGTCSSAIKDPSNFNNANWEIASVKLYQ